MEKFKKGLVWFLHSYIWLFVIFIITDIVSKNLIVKNMNPGDSIPLIKGFLHITYRVNPAAAFSIGFDNNTANLIIYSIFAIGATIGILFYYIRYYKKISGFIKACLMLVLVGALGNLIDRTFYSAEYLKNSVGGVVDFIDFCGIWDAVFNVADSCIVIAAIMFLVYAVVEEVKDRKAKTEKMEAREAQLSATEKAMNESRKDK